MDAVEQAVSSGQAVLYIRNTVDDALEAHTVLARARGIKADVFHARFALVDRLEIEKQVVATFGKSSTPERRIGKVLVATQVVEQSLDLDFDTLITDLAPVDLLIQRAGRLWRHHRPAREGRPEVLVVGPEPIADADAEWFQPSVSACGLCLQGSRAPVADGQSAVGRRLHRKPRRIAGAH